MGHAFSDGRQMWLTSFANKLYYNYFWFNDLGPSCYTTATFHDIRNNSSEYLILGWLHLRPQPPVCAMLCDVTSLSDEDREAAVAQHDPQPSDDLPALPLLSESERSTPRSRKRPLQNAEDMLSMMADIRRDLSRLVHSNCRCLRKRRSRVKLDRVQKQSCFAPFRDPGLFDKVVRLRKTIRTMHKSDADQTVAWHLR